MPDVSDMELLRDYARHGSEAAFAELVRRHVNLVYSAALRQVGIAAHAEEITQAVFVILAQKATRLRPDSILEGWFYQTARLTALSFLRGERRRQWREQEACMQSALQESGEPLVWNQLAPLLDEAMARLGKTDREAVVLRYFKGKSLHEVAAALKMTEAAAQSRVHRAVGKLHKYFLQHGIDSTAAAVAGAISANSIQAAPVGLAKAVTTVALAKGTAASTSTVTLIKGSLKFMAWTKAKTVVVVGAAALLATGTTVVVVKKAISPSVDKSFWQLKTESLRKAPAVLIIRPARYSDNGMVSLVSRSTNNDKPILRKVVAHNLDFAGLLQTAYSINRQRMVFLTDVPTGRYDLLLTLPDHPLEALQQKIQRQFGILARPQVRETNVLVLKVKTPELFASHVSKRGSKMNFKNGRGLWAFSNFPISNVSDFLENVVFHKPVVVQPELPDRYSITFQWKNPQDLQQAVSDELAQAGLELIPTNLPIKVLVVEKAK